VVNFTSLRERIDLNDLASAVTEKLAYLTLDVTLKMLKD